MKLDCRDRCAPAVHRARPPFAGQSTGAAARGTGLPGISFARERAESDCRAIHRRATASVPPEAHPPSREREPAVCRASGPPASAGTPNAGQDALSQTRAGRLPGNPLAHAHQSSRCRAIRPPASTGALGAWQITPRAHARALDAGQSARARPWTPGMPGRPPCPPTGRSALRGDEVRSRATLKIER